MLFVFCSILQHQLSLLSTKWEFVSLCSQDPLFQFVLSCIFNVVTIFRSVQCQAVDQLIIITAVSIRQRLSRVCLDTHHILILFHIISESLPWALFSVRCHKCRSLSGLKLNNIRFSQMCLLVGYSTVMLMSQM